MKNYKEEYELLGICKYDEIHSIFDFQQYHDYEYEDFTLLRNADESYVQFDSKEEVIQFLFDNFDKETIDPDLMIDESKNGYYFG